jgi:beta-glucanase (GH16 family)
MLRKFFAVALCAGGLAVAQEWKLVWSDDFNGSGPVDPKNWKFEQGYIRNKEAQFYTDMNARRQNGALMIEARREGNRITSGSVTTDGLHSWTYGRIEVRAKLPTGDGTWAAIWMLGQNIKQVGWPTSGEIDIMENAGFDPDVIHANVHTTAYNHVSKNGKGAKTVVEKPYADYHIYSMDWTPEQMDFFVDGKKYFTYANEKTGSDAWPFDKPQYLILNLAIGGSWGGREGVDPKIFPQRFEIDYVRVYQQ